MKRFYKKVLIMIIMGWLFLLTAMPASATSLQFVPLDQTRLLGEAAAVDIWVLGGMPLGVGAFDFNVNYNPAIVSLSSIIFGSDLGFTIGPGFVDTAGSLNLYDLSLEFPEDLLAMQSNDFRIATLTFNTLAVGISPLSFSGPVSAINPLGLPLLWDAYENSIALDSPAAGSITVAAGAVSVPESDTLLLLGMGLIGITMLIMINKAFQKMKL